MNLQQLIKDACADRHSSDEEDGANVIFNNTYSGRGMYGNYCIGIVGRPSDIQEVIAEVALSVMEESIDVVQRDGISSQVFGVAQIAMRMLLTCQKTDSMGRDVIIYWPSLTPIQE